MKYVKNCWINLWKLVIHGMPYLINGGRISHIMHTLIHQAIKTYFFFYFYLFFCIVTKQTQTPNTNLKPKHSTKTKEQSSDKKEEREYPQAINNGELGVESRNYELRKDLVEHRDFEWIHKELWDHLVRWFGIEQDSPVFPRKVISQGITVLFLFFVFLLFVAVQSYHYTNSKQKKKQEETSIEMFPFYISTCTTTDGGDPDFSTTKLWFVVVLLICLCVFIFFWIAVLRKDHCGFFFVMCSPIW